MSKYIICDFPLKSYLTLNWLCVCFIKMPPVLTAVTAAGSCFHWQKLKTKNLYTTCLATEEWQSWWLDDEQSGELAAKELEISLRSWRRPKTEPDDQKTQWCYSAECINKQLFFNHHKKMNLCQSKERLYDVFRLVECNMFQYCRQNIISGKHLQRIGQYQKSVYPALTLAALA